MLYEFDYHAPKSQRELLDILSGEGGNARILAGGTDLMVNIRLGFVRPGRVVDLKKIPAHGQITFTKTEGLTIGPAVTINQLMNNPVVQKQFPVLIEAGKVLASHQLRNRATVIGNLCNASPCADMAPPLLCLGARVVLIGSKGNRRELSLPEFFIGVKKTKLATDEYCEAIVVPPGAAGARGGFQKLKRVKGHDIGVLSVCLLKQRDLMRVAIGSAAPTPILLKDFTAKTAPDRICQEALRSISPIDDVRGSADYRNFMAQTYIRNLLKEVR